MYSSTMGGKVDDTVRFGGTGRSKGAGGVVRTTVFFSGSGKVFSVTSDFGETNEELCRFLVRISDNSRMTGFKIVSKRSRIPLSPKAYLFLVSQ